MKSTRLILIVYFISAISVISQENKWELNGYISAMGSYKMQKGDTIIFPPDGKSNYKDALLHNRLNFFWYPSGNITFSVQLRNRLLYNETFSDIPGVDDMFEEDAGLMQLSKNIFYDDDWLLNSSIDRLYLQYTLFDNLEITVGRQRINWSQTFAWNPNDIFNASNYFDFDYAEKPGSDAIRLQYYTGMASSAQLVTKMDDKKNITTAGLYRFNLKGYDFQFLSGIMNEEEFVVGAGWMGNIKSSGFRGELTTLIPYKDSSEYNHSMDNLFMSSVSFDYTFPKNAYLMAEFLYSNSDIASMAGSFTSFLSGPTTIRNLAFSRFSSLISFTYPVHPLVNVSLSGMHFYKITGYYIGANADVSVTDNLSFSFYWQFFDMLLSKEKQIMMDDLTINYLFCRVKYNF